MWVDYGLVITYRVRYKTGNCDEHILRGSQWTERVTFTHHHLIIISTISIKFFYHFVVALNRTTSILSTNSRMCGLVCDSWHYSVHSWLLIPWYLVRTTATWRTITVRLPLFAGLAVRWRSDVRDSECKLLYQWCTVTQTSKQVYE